MIYQTTTGRRQQTTECVNVHGKTINFNQFLSYC